MIVEPLSYYNLALPDDLTWWTVPAQGIRRWDEEALVYDVGYGGTILCHYSGSGKDSCNIRNEILRLDWKHYEDAGTDTNNRTLLPDVPIRSLYKSGLPGR